MTKLEIELVDASDSPERTGNEARNPTRANPTTPSEGRPSLVMHIDKIRRDEALMCRVGGLRKATVAQYAEAMTAGAVFPPVVVFADGRGVHWLADGFHRTDAAVVTGRTEIEAEIRDGNRRDALLHAASANAAHGLRRTTADKRRAVELVLASFPKWSDRKIGEACGVDHKTVSRLRPKPTGEVPQLRREGADGRVRGLPPFDSVRELSRLERTIGAALDRWPTDDGEGLARVRAMLASMAARLGLEVTTVGAPRPSVCGASSERTGYIELCAGTGAVGLALLGAPEFPCSRFGSKRGYADAVLEEMGLARGSLAAGASVVFVEADTRVASVLDALVNRPGAVRAAVLQLVNEHPDERALWQEVRWTPGAAESLLWMAGARGGTGRWRGGHKLRPNAGGFSPKLETLDERLAAFVDWFADRKASIEVIHEDASRVDPRSRPASVVYLDPPYGVTRYRNELDGSPSDLAWRWAEAGHRVFMSYDRPLDDPRVRSVDLSSRRRGQRRTNATPEWLICFPHTAA